MSAAVRRVGGWLVAALACAGCPGEEEQLVPRQFNGEDTFEVSVAPGEVGPSVVRDLTSSTGSAVVGTITIEPGSGPVGTEHRLTVVVAPEFTARIDLAEVEIEPVERDPRTIALEQDSADPGVWVRTVQSFGVDGEVRTDLFTVRLFELVPATTP